MRSTKNSTFAPVLKRGSLWYTLSLGYGVMVTLQILVLPFLVRVRVAQPSISWRERPGDAATIFLGYGVMVTLQILVLPFLVRVRVAQRSQKRVCSSRANSLSLYIPYILHPMLHHTATTRALYVTSTEPEGNRKCGIALRARESILYTVLPL